MLKLVSWTIIIATLALAITFAFFNKTVIPFNYLLGEIKLPLYVLIFGSLLGGVLIGLMLDAMLLFRQKLRIRKLEKDKLSTETELSNLRKMPIKDLQP
jgi:uncharacterized integral membrane protein